MTEMTVKYYRPKRRHDIVNHIKSEHASDRIPTALTVAQMEAAHDAVHLRQLRPDLKPCGTDKGWFGEPHGPHADEHDCWDNVEGGSSMGWYCARCGFLVQVS